MKKWFALCLSVVALVGVGWFSANRGLNAPDDVLIRELFQRGEQSIETRDLGMAMSCVSGNFKGALGPMTMDYMMLKQLVAGGFKKAQAYDVQMDVPQVRYSGDDADAATKVSIDNVTGGTREGVFSGSITVKLRKEPVRRYWVFPVKEWKIVSFESPKSLEHGEDYGF